MNSKIKRTIAAVSAMALCAGITVSDSIKSFVNENAVTADAASSSSRMRIDINRNDGRSALWSPFADNWNFTGDAYTLNGITFKLSNGGNVGQGVDCTNNKKLQKYDGTTPYLTADGVKIKDGDNGGVLKLEISGLSAGTHSFSGWHSCLDGVTASSLKLTVNGKTVMTGIKCPSNIANSNDAGRSYAEFSVSAGQTVTILIQGEGNQSYNNAWLNAFEIDGASPIASISKFTPEDRTKHNNIEDGLNWTAGQGASSHDVYIGTDFNSVFNASKSSPEYKGTVTKPHFDLDSSYSSLPVYYWRVDENGSNGTVKGSVYSFQLNRLAFPTAEGYGRWARGGRGGRIVEVTNLNDSGTGSLRQALEVEKGPRTVIFRVGGVIELKSVLCIPSDGGDVYVAGQTAPGDGITLINYDFGAMGAEDVVIRDVRVRVGDMNGKSTGGMGVTSCNNTIIDHCSISWATDEGFSSRSASNITFQWNIIGESLNESVHYDASNRDQTEPHSFAASISGNKGSFHHNLLIDCTGRNWSLAGGMEQDAVTYGGALDIRNNVVYNWRDRTTDGGVRRLNFVNNYYKAGSVSNTGLHVVSLDGNELNTSDMQKMYVSGNVMMGKDGKAILSATDDAWAKGKAVSGGKNSTVNDVKSTSPFFESYVNTDSADSAYKKVIDNTSGAGANVPKLDYIDSRYHKEVTNGSYTYKGSKAGLTGIVDSQKDAGGYPNSNNFKGGTAPTDTDKDGMPDAWETAHGLNPKSAADGPIVSLSGDDYTNLEMYLNELAGDTVNYNGAPAKSAFETIEAEEYSSESGTKNQEGEGETHVAYIENGDYIGFRNLDFENGAKSFTAKVTGNASAIEIYLDSPSGTPAASIDFTGTGNWNSWTDISANIPSISGIHDVYLVFKGGEGYLLNIDNFKFSKDSLPLNGRLVKNLTVLDSERSASWNIVPKAEEGGTVYGDRAFTFVNLPAELIGAEHIMTACDSKNSADHLAEFTAAEDITLYVALDSRVENVPAWMSEFEKTSLSFGSSNDVSFVVYSKSVKSGEKVTLGTNGQSAYCINYTAFASDAKKIIGDINADGKFTIADAVLLQKWLINTPDTHLADWKNGDLCKDGTLDVFDLCMMKRMLISK